MGLNKFTNSKERLGGVKYWAQWYPIYRKPQYDLYVYVGCEKSIGQYYFANYKRPHTMVCRNINQIINDLSFRPFLLENEHIDAYIRSIGPPVPPIRI